MWKSKISLIALPVAAVLVATLSGCGRGVIARVNSDNITKSEFFSKLEAVPVQTPQGPQQAGSYIMQQLITQDLITQLAKKEGVPATDAQVNAKLDYQKKISGPDFEKTLQMQGTSLAQWKAQEKINQSYVNVVTKGVTVPESDVKKAYEKALSLPNSPFVRPQQVLVSGIGCKDQAKIQKVYKLLGQGQDFGAVAVSMSELPGANQSQGVLGWVAKNSRLPKNVVDTAFSLQVGSYSKPMLIQNEWVIIKTDQKRPERTLSYSDVKDAVREALEIQKGSATGNFAREFQKFVKDANIDVRMSAYKGIADALKKNATKQLQLMANAKGNGLVPASSKK